MGCRGACTPRKGWGGQGLLLMPLRKCGGGCIMWPWDSPWSWGQACAVGLTIAGATQLVVRVAVVLDQVLHMAMLNLYRLCTAPLCRQRMLSCLETQPRTSPQLWRVLPQSRLPCPTPAPCQPPPALPKPSAPPALCGTSGSCSLQHGPGQAGNQQRCGSAGQRVHARHGTHVGYTLSTGLPPCC